MNLKGRVLGLYMPASVRRKALVELFAATASAFGAAMPDVAGMTPDEMLERYAYFTASHASRAIARTRDVAVIGRELYESARAIGARLRTELGVESNPDAMAAARGVYRALRIDFAGSAAGDVRVTRCFFSRYYSPAVCELMSALDRGLIAGLTAGGRLEFRQRITEGAPSCIATFEAAR